MWVFLFHSFGGGRGQCFFLFHFFLGGGGNGCIFCYSITVDRGVSGAVVY